VVGLTRLWREKTLTDRGRVRDEGDGGSDGDEGSGEYAVDADAEEGGDDGKDRSG